MLASRLFRSSFVLLPMLCAAAYAAGCSDDDPVSPGAADGGTDAPVTPTDSGHDASVTNPLCATDLDVDKLYKHLSCTGLYANYLDKTLSADAQPYKPSTEFWSDGAEKTRWLYLPPNSKIDTTNMDEWSFPVGTKVWKEFKLGGKRIETRLFTKLADGWTGLTYRWKADESDAERLEGGETIPGLGPDGGAYEIATAQQCNECHGGRKDFLMGVDAISLGLPNATGLTLAKLVDEKRLTVDPPVKTLAYPVATAAQGGDKAGPALAWLHINCGTACHNANPGAGASFTKLYMMMKPTQLMPLDGGPVTVDKLDGFDLTVCKDSKKVEGAGPANYKLIRQGDPTRSWISVVSGQRQPAAEIQMPPLGTHAVDIDGHKVLEDWIKALTGSCP